MLGPRLIECRRMLPKPTARVTARSRRRLPAILNSLQHASSTHPNGPVAQRLEQRTHNPLVVGSNPTGPTNHPIESSRVSRASSFGLRAENELLKLFYDCLGSRDGSSTTRDNSG